MAVSSYLAVLVLFVLVLLAQWLKSDVLSAVLTILIFVFVLRGGYAVVFLPNGDR